MATKKIHLCALALCLVSMGGMAQELNKEITLDKDFVPVEKKAVKKSTLPKVIKPAKSTLRNEIKYSNWTQPTTAPTGIPTMLPYGYRTSHIFSKQKGYVDLKAGTQLNIAGSAGYRLANQENLKSSLWLQHNSTWTGKNSSKRIENDADRLKQKFNDNAIGVDLNSSLPAGDLDLGARVHLDYFNYYGGMGSWWDKNKQTLVDVLLNGHWKSNLEMGDGHLRYQAGLSYNYAGYNKSLADGYSGAKQHHIHVTLGGKYEIDDRHAVGMDTYIDHINTSFSDLEKVSYNDNMSMLTLSPFYTVSAGDDFHARLGGNVSFSFSDGAKIRISPQVELSYELTPGLMLYGNVTGGKQLNTLSRMAALSRYSDPFAMHGNTFSPFNTEMGINIGPFQGFTFKAFTGFGVFKDDQLAYIPFVGYWNGLAAPAPTTVVTPTALNRYAALYYRSFNTRGAKIGAEVAYQYRSLAEVSAKGVFAPQKDEINTHEYYNGYTLGLDRPKYVLDFNAKFRPMRPLTVRVGLEVRGDRKALYQLPTGDSESNAATFRYSFYTMSDAVNLHADASYRFDKVLTLWLQTSNLLNKKWDVMPGMGAQRLGVMGGLSVVF